MPPSRRTEALLHQDKRRGNPNAKWYGAVAVALVLAIVCGGLAIYSRFNQLRVEKDYPPIGRMVAAGGANLHYIRTGEGRPVVMIHGGAVTLQDFVYSIYGDLAKSFDAIAFDRRGHGYSTRVPDEPLTVAGDARILSDALTKLGVEKPILIGHSYGAATAVQLALDHPEQVGGLVLLAPVIYSTTDSVPFPARIAEMPVIGPMFVNLLLLPAGKGHLPGHIRDSFTPQYPPQRYEDTMTAFGLLPGNFKAWAEERHHFTPDLNAVSARLRELRVPVSIIAGDKDPLTPLKDHGERLHAEIAGSELTVLPGVGHMVHYANPPAVIAAIKRAADRAAKP